MKQTYTWLLIAVLLAFLAPSAAMAEGDAGFSSSVEVGAAGMSVDGEVNKVNEYNATRDDNGINPYVKANLAGSNDSTHVEVDAAVMGEDVMNIDLDVDASRIFRFETNYDRFNHWLSHDQLNYMDATMKNTAGSSNPAVYSEDLVPGQDFFIIHKELELESEVVVPDLPNITIKAGFRQEEREGVEQVFGLSHCSACHVEGSAKKIDETTTDITLGATGKFGMLTIDYEYLTREFEDDSVEVMRDYLVAGVPIAPYSNSATFRGRLLFDGYSGDEYIYSDTPESKKDSHSLKARLDMSESTVVSANYIHAEVESNKSDDVGMTLSTNQLSTDYDSYSMRASTRLGAWRLSGYGRREELDASDNTLTFLDANGVPVSISTDRATYQSEEAREVTTLGGNAVYRINSGTSVRLGYEYEDIDREIEHAQNTESHTLKASVRFRPNSKLNGRASYTYKKINDAFMNHLGNKGPEDQTVYNPGDGQWYDEAFYSQRLADATNQPEDIHDIKVSTTWTPGVNYSVTGYLRYRMEENELNFNTYEKDVISPGVNVWWAPLNNLNLTMAYNFDKQKTENQMCVGWYHG